MNSYDAYSSELYSFKLGRLDSPSLPTWNKQARGCMGVCRINQRLQCISALQKIAKLIETSESFLLQTCQPHFQKLSLHVHLHRIGVKEVEMLTTATSFIMQRTRELPVN